MNFQNVNSLNVRLNLLSGNLLPMINRDSAFSSFWKIYSVFVWICELIVVIVNILGCIYVEGALKDGSYYENFVMFMEAFFMIMRIHTRKDLVYQLIKKLNEILQTADQTMKNIMTATLEPIKAPLHFYWFAGVISNIAWGNIPLVLIFKKNTSYYEDYTMPASFAILEQFSFRIFLVGSLFLLITTIIIFLKKVAVDVYMVHLVLMITAQYRYIALKTAMIFQEEIKYSKSQKHSPGLNRKKEKEIKALCRHHNDVVYLTSLLKELLSINFSLIYINSVFRFCFIGIMLSGLSSTSFWEAIAFAIYASASIVELYILCSCVQQLLDASTDLTDNAFHEHWYVLQPSVKRIFIMIIMANNLECKIAIFETFNLSLPSFMTILNQSYSVALLFLKMQ